MPRKGFTLRVPALGLLSEAEIESIHRGTLRTLAETGVRMDSAWARGFLARHGCRVVTLAPRPYDLAGVYLDVIAEAHQCP